MKLKFKNKLKTKMPNDGVEFGDKIETVGNFAVAVEIQLRLDVIFYKQSNTN